VLVIDELAQVDPDALEILGRHIVPVGRSKRVHVVAATQHPTVKLIGDKSNYPVRLVGQVVDGATAAIATGRRSSGAEVLPGAGAFLYVDGPQLDRLQAYNLTTDSAVHLIRTICDKWRDAAPPAPVRTGAEPAIPTPAPAEIPLFAPVRTGAGGAPPVQFPIPRRAPTLEEAAAIRQLRAELGSLNQTILAAYGSKSSDTHRWVSEALAAPPAPPQTPQAPILRMAGGAR
jgi:DNA segregation ATPase FtsK/SpoIIIE-like protein